MKTFVISGNYIQYEKFLQAKKLNKTDYPYLKGVAELYGLPEVNVIKTGTWWLRKDIEPLMKEIGRIRSDKHNYVEV